MSINLFQSNFILSPDPMPIVIYGLGKQTEDILSQCDDERIIGVLDGFRKEGFFCGKSILTLEELQGKKVKVVIVARAASEKIIYKRIHGFCEKNGISIYNIYGEDLSVRKAIKDDPYFLKSKDELIERAMKYDSISFDIFDTLITRKVSDREFFYKIVGKYSDALTSFESIRLLAEHQLSLSGCPSLMQIYEKIMIDSNISTDDMKQLMDAELALEKWNLIPRKEMVQIFNRLLEAGKSVYLISDMYFSKEYLTEILENCGITGYRELFISCEYGTDKTQGLFDIYKKLACGNSYLHIGDSIEADELASQRHGIDSYIVKASNDMAELTELDKLSDDALSSLTFSSLFNSPFALENAGGRVHLADAYSVGYALLGPLVAGFSQWLIEKTSSSKLDKICFISRDGYLFKQGYELFTEGMKDVPKAVYLETSRRLNVISSLKNLEDLYWAFDFPYDGTIAERLINQFGLNENEILPINDGESDREYFLRHAVILLNKAKSVRDNYRKYLSGFGLNNGSTAIFDFVSTGTCQVGLEDMLGFSLKGYYFEKLDSEDYKKQKLDVTGYVNDKKPDAKLDQYFLIENWIKETVPSVKSISDDCRVIRCENRMKAEQVQAIKLMQEGALAYCRDLLALHGLGINLDAKSWALRLIELVNDSVLCLEEIEWPIFDEFTGRWI